MNAADMFSKEDTNKENTNFVQNYRNSINPPYKPKDFITLGITLFLLLAIPITVFVANRSRDTRSQAAGTKMPSVFSSREKEIISNQVLVKLKKTAKVKSKEIDPKNTGEVSIDNLNKKHKVTKFHHLAKVATPAAEVNQWYSVTADFPSKKLKAKYNTKTGKIDSKDDSARKLESLIADLKTDPNVLAVEPNYIIQLKAIPNDPFYSSTGSWGQSYSDLWGIKKINPQTAWDQTTGSSSVIVAVVDTGVDRNHSDLAANMWQNNSEKGTTTQQGATPNCTSRGLTLDKSCNNLDDDSNGYIDDTNGWDFINNDNDPNDDYGHGTHIAGTIGAVGNNSSGVVGVSWVSKIMALKVFDQVGYATVSSIVSALTYAADMQAKVSNLSWGCYCESDSIEDAVTYEHDAGMVVVAAAGNESWDSLDLTPANSDKVVTVAASESTDAVAYFSNYGEKIDVVAPGVDILSLKSSINLMCGVTKTVATNYCRVSGTSMATPHVVGLAVLLFAKNPALTNEQVRQILRRGATDLGTAGKDQDFGYGRIDATASMNLALGNPLAPVITSPTSRTLISGASVNITGTIPGTNFSSYKVEVGAGRAPVSWTTVTTSSSQILNGTLATLNTSTLNDGYYIVRITATDTGLKTYQYQVNDIAVNNFNAEITLPVYWTDKGLNSVYGVAETKNGVVFSNYKIEWGIGFDPVTYYSTGITLANNGNQAINGYLGSWDSSTLSANQYYSLRLTVTSTVGTNATYISEIYLENPPPPPPPPPAPVKVGDLNGDNKVNIYDLSILLSKWKKAVTVGADLNNDGKVDIYDLSILLSKWGK